jgi:hypothetical protein
MVRDQGVFHTFIYQRVVTEKTKRTMPPSRDTVSAAFGTHCTGSQTTVSAAANAICCHRVQPQKRKIRRWSRQQICCYKYKTCGKHNLISPIRIFPLSNHSPFSPLVPELNGNIMTKQNALKLWCKQHTSYRVYKCHRAVKRTSHNWLSWCRL